MLFNSLEYMVFLPAVLAIYFALPARHRWIFLLVSSYYFYICWRVSYAVLLVGSTLTDFTLGRLIDRSADPRIRKRYLYLSLLMNLGLLFTFKYFNFFNGSLRFLFEQFGLAYPFQDLNLVLPVGISFYTFQSLAYIIDIYRGKVKAERSLFRFAFFVAYFPQLVAGPISRASNLLPQLRQHFAFDYERVRNGLALILWGLVKKLVIADRLAEYTQVVFSQPAAHHGLQIWLADYFFVIQLYCDFSGYTDIALGSAGIMGVSLMQNFRQPLLCRSINDVWSRWHISLTTWFRDYLFVYLGGRRASKQRMLSSIFVVFLLNGLWHGANWTFVAFGATHGLLLVGYYLLRPGLNRFYARTGLDRRPRLAIVLGNVISVALFAYVGNFFRAQSIGDSWILIQNSLHFSQGYDRLNLFPYAADLWISLAFMAVLYASEFIGELRGHARWLAERPAWFRWFLIAAGIASVVVLGKWGAISFIYFQF